MSKHEILEAFADFEVNGFQGVGIIDLANYFQIYPYHWLYPYLRKLSSQGYLLKIPSGRRVFYRITNKAWEWLGYYDYGKKPCRNRSCYFCIGKRT
jgi:hypothetical protein